VCTGATAVYNCVNPPFAQWRAVYPEVMRSLIAAAGASGAVLAVADDTWMYGRVDGVMTEETPAGPVTDLGVLAGVAGRPGPGRPPPGGRPSGDRPGR